MSKQDYAQHKFTNRLIEETSPYLLQHRIIRLTGTPGKRAPLSARGEKDKPILLSIGYRAYWCHVMEDESFEDEAIAQLMNDNFINIKVI